MRRFATRGLTGPDGCATTVRSPLGCSRHTFWYGPFPECCSVADFNGDGKPDLVTGKRLFAHHGRDTSCYDPLFAFWYDLSGGKCVRHVLSYNHLRWYPEEKNHNPAPNGAIAVGMKLNIVDLDKDGRNDTVVAGKPGLYVFYNQGVTPRERGKIRMSPEETYPSWVPWYGK